MYCRNCGELMNDNQAICIKCGVKTGDGNRFCQNCGETVEPNAAICMKCGVAIKTPTSEYLGGKDKIVMALICFFLGGLGIHNFILGETKKGILKIVLSLCFGVGAILALIDFIKILLDKYEVDPEKLI